MGNAYSWTHTWTQMVYHKVYNLFYDPKFVLVCGLDNAGKTCLLNTLQHLQAPTVPTMGFNAETVHIGHATVQVFDMCGQDTRRDGWKMFFQHADALVYVVDANDVQRLYESGTELARIRHHSRFPDVPILILANKQDEPRAATPAQVMRGMRLDGETRPWRVAGTVVKHDEGIQEPMAWLVQQMYQ